jgi:hypothetical protein
MVRSFAADMALSAGHGLVEFALGLRRRHATQHLTPWHSLGTI